MSAKVQYLYCKPDGYYYSRRRIPSDLICFFPPNFIQIRKSLRTKNLKTAKEHAKIWSYRTEKLFTLIRSGMLTDEQLKQLIAKDLFNKQEQVTFVEHDSNANPTPKQQQCDDKEELFSTVVEGYIKEKQLAESWTIKTKDENQASFDLFTLVIGDRPIKTFNRQDFMKFRNTLSKLPPNMNKSKLYKGKSIDEVLAMKPEDTLSKRTINKRLTHVSSVFGWSLLNQYINANYASELLLPITATAQDDKKVFSKEDLQKVINHLPCDQRKPERF